MNSGVRIILFLSPSLFRPFLSSSLPSSFRPSVLAISEEVSSTSEYYRTVIFLSLLSLSHTLVRAYSSSRAGHTVLFLGLCWTFARFAASFHFILPDTFRETTTATATRPTAPLPSSLFTNFGRERRERRTPSTDISATARAVRVNTALRKRPMTFEDN